MYYQFSFSMLAAMVFAIAKLQVTIAEPTGEKEAIRECGNVHDIDMHQFPNNTSAKFINDECALNCTVDGRVMNTVSINEGYVCPRNVRGHCRHGKCDAPPNPEHHGDAVTQCGNLNHVDTHLFNNSGTHYSEAECKVFCFINGQEASEHNINEGYQCPANKNGTCKAGACVISSTVPTKPPTQETTTQKPTTLKKTPILPPETTTTRRGDTFENIEIERVSARFIDGKMNDGTMVKNISVCYKTNYLRTFDRTACKYYCSSTEISCIIQSPDRQFPKDQSYFLFNVWEKEVSIGDSFKPIKELFKDVKEEPRVMIAHNGKENYNMLANTNLNLYNMAKEVGKLTFELELNYRRT